LALASREFYYSGAVAVTESKGRRAVVTGAAQHFAGLRASVPAVIHHQLAVDQNIVDAGGIALWILVCRGVLQGVVVEDGEVGFQSLADGSSVIQPHPRR